MSRNLFNLFAVFVILIVVTACVCNSDRFGEKSKTPESSPSPSEKTANDEKKTDNDGKKSPEKDKGDFVVDQEDVKDSRFEDLHEQMKSARSLEKAAERLNRALSLPNDVYMRTKDCGQISAYYDPNDSSVTVCYELMEHFFKVFKSNGDNDKVASQKMSEAIQFVFLHEIGHALIDTLKLPVTANEEDAADRLSSYVNLEELGEDGVNAVLSAAEAFRIESKGKVPSARSLADEHLLEEQRFYNALCMLYGSNMQKYSDIVEKGFLPEARAVRCPSEYERTVESWVKILEPWRKK